MISWKIVKARQAQYLAGFPFPPKEERYAFYI